MHDLWESIEQVENLSKELLFMRKESFSRQDMLQKEIDAITEENSLLEKVSSLFKHLLDNLLEEKKKEIEDLVTYGLKTVFSDQDLKFNITIESKYNSIHTNFKTEQVDVAEGNVLDSFGGGIVNVESFLLRIITLFQTNLAPFLFLDETFSHLSSEYVENGSLLLNNLCKKLGLTVFLITHQELMLTHADKVYKASSKNNKFILSEK